MDAITPQGFIEHLGQQELLISRSMRHFFTLMMLVIISWVRAVDEGYVAAAIFKDLIDVNINCIAET